jgi:hypothetical protein
MSHRFVALCVVLASGAIAQPRRTQNVVLVMTDGLRWQEVFKGADAALMNDKQREFPAGQREALLPFFWQVIAQNGQIYGNRALGSDAYVTNGLNFSYPGYNETLAGFVDPRIISNDKVPNPNVTVLEWLNQKAAYRGKVTAFGAWGVISSIVNSARAGFVANSGYEPLTAPPVTDRIALINRLKDETQVWEDEPFDSFTFRTALEYLKLHRPRVLYLSLGETDEWAHRGDYALYLKSAHRVDQYLRELWETVQSIDQYRGKTTLIFLTDHGRGEAPEEWKSHGEKIDGSKFIWMAFLGPDTRALGERSKIAPVTQSQIASTLAALLGEEYDREVPKAGKRIEDVLRSTKTSTQ